MKRMKIIAGILTTGCIACAMSSRTPTVLSEDAAAYRVSITRTQMLGDGEPVSSVSCAYDLHIRRTAPDHRSAVLHMKAWNISLPDGLDAECMAAWMQMLSNTAYRASIRNEGRRVDVEGFKPLMRRLQKDWMRGDCPERDLLMFLQWFGNAAVERVLMRMFPPPKSEERGGVTPPPTNEERGGVTPPPGMWEVERTVKDPLLGEVVVQDRYRTESEGRIETESTWRVERHQEDLPSEWNIADYRDEPARETGAVFRTGSTVWPERGAFDARQTIHVTGGGQGEETIAVRLIQHLTFERTGFPP